MRKKLIKSILLSLLLLALVYGLYYGYRAATIATAYTSKITCSCIFVSGRTLESVRKEDLSKYGYIDQDVDHVTKTVSSTILGIVSRKAIYREKLGCTLAVGISEEELTAQVNTDKLISPVKQENKPWPIGDSTGRIIFPPEIDSLKLTQAVTAAFVENDPEKIKRTRALIIVYKGKIITEKYAQGITPQMPLLGWSMTKSVTNAITGVLVRQGKFTVQSRPLIPEWQKTGDPRQEITLNHLLQMSSGLEFIESYSVVTDATVMLFDQYHAGAYAADKELDYTPGSLWDYSSGTTNIISTHNTKTIDGTLEDKLSFPRNELFNKIGMSTAVMEPDPSGHFVGSSFMYATARDWARFGLLYLNDGMWEGVRILPEGWVKYTVTPAPTAPEGEYGAHFWLNAGTDASGLERQWPDLPKDLFYAAGFEGQHIVIVPSKDLVIVRLGNTQQRGAWKIQDFIKEVLNSFNLPLFN